MRTKEQIFEFIATELKNNNTVIIATLGNGGCLDIVESEYVEATSEIYQFSGNDGYKVQILTY